MLTGEKFAHYLMEQAGFENFNIKRSKDNSKFRFNKGIPTIFLLEKHSLNDWTSIEVAAHEVGHAIDLKDSGTSILMSYVYVYSGFFLLAAFFSKIFIIPLSLFSLICAILYIKSELKADYFKRILIKKYLKEALLKFNDSRNPNELIHEIDKKIKKETFQIYRIGIVTFIIFPFVLVLAP
jgi:uncharacterized membrane protein YciS (DUF1049 family)